MTEGSHADDSAAREAFRAGAVAAIPRWYSPWVHFGVPPLFAMVVSCACWRSVHDLRPWQILVAPLTWLFINLAEWWGHRSILHRPMWGLGAIYRSHALLHHRVFVNGDMAVRSARELYLVLISSFAFIALTVFWFLPTYLIALVLVDRNVAVIALIATFGYFHFYEWLHLCYHLPSESWIGRRALVRRLRALHALHHDPRNMQRHNFNVTVPLFDWVMGTWIRS